MDELIGPDLGLDFGVALALLKAGCRVYRRGWNGKGMYLILVQGSRFTVNRPPLLGVYPPGTEIEYHAHIDMKTAQGYVVPWVASQSDLLAEDWEALPATAVESVGAGEATVPSATLSSDAEAKE